MRIISSYRQFPIYLLFSIFLFQACESEQRSKNEAQENSHQQIADTIGTALIDGVTEYGEKYNVNIWQFPGTKRGKVVVSLAPNTPLIIKSMKMIDDIPWFKIETKTGEEGYVNLMHLREIRVNSSILGQVSIDYQKIQEDYMLSDKIIKKKKIKPIE